MRTLAVILAVLAISCARPSRKRFTDQLASVGSRLVAVVRSGAVKVDANMAIKAAAQTPPPSSRVHEDPPPQQVQRHQAAPDREAPPPDIQVQRTDASRPTVFVLRGQTHGGKELCEQHATLDACTSACTAMLRPNMFSKPEPGMPKSCACNEQDTGC